jgi:outer membrane protein insertion porin family
VLPTLFPLGGNALAVFNFELRYPLASRVRIAPFYDLGNVFRRVSDFRFSDMTNTVGLGMRIHTPLGPLGVDYGFLIDPPVFSASSGALLRQPRGAIHIRFGQTF